MPLFRLDDLHRLHEKLRQGYARRLVKRFVPGATARTQAAWQHTASAPKHWGSLDAVTARFHRKVSGSGETLHDYTLRTQWPGRTDLVALSIGCGTGGNERRWAETGAFARIDAVDLSPERIAEATRRAQEAGLGDVLRFAVADARSLDAPEASYDVILAEGALHHISPLDPAVAALARRLKPDGRLVLRDFVGPSRFQWTDAQVAAADALLATIPGRLRTRWGSGRVKTRVLRPGTLAMRLMDPSEAAESDRILEVLDRHFRLLDRKDLGGTVLHLVLDDLAFHFQDGEGAAWLAALFNAEDALLAGGLPSDFVYAVYATPH